MKVYILFLLTAITNCYMIVLFLGASSGFANYIPIIAMVSSVVLFTIAAPLLALYAKAGYMLGALCCLAILPYNISFLAYMLKDKSYYTIIGATAAIPSISTIATAYTLRPTRYQQYKAISGRYSRLVCATVPIILFSIYLLSISRHFNIK